MTPILQTKLEAGHLETNSVCELDYLIGELLASDEFSIMATMLSVWVFLRMYWFGLSIFSRLTTRKSHAQ